MGPGSKAHELTQRRAPASRTGSGSLLLSLMKLRTFIALFAVLLFFSLTAPNFLSTANLDPDVQACRAQRLPGHGHDLRHHHRRHRPVGRLDRRPRAAWSRAIWCSTASTCQIGYTSISTSSRSSLITLCVGMLIGAINGLLITRLNVAPFIATLGTLYVARGAGAAVLGRPDLPQPGRQAGTRHTGFGFLGAGRILGLPVSIWILIVLALRRRLSRPLHAARPPHLRGRRQRARGAHVRHARRPGEDVRLHVLRLLRRDRRPRSSPRS